MPKQKDNRYLNQKEDFLKFAYQALEDQFADRKEFIDFFENIKGIDQKNLFLKTASFYLLLVKKGEWLINVPGYEQRIDYLNHTYKYIAIFSLIESLYEKQFIDFYSYLIGKKNKIKFPIEDKNQLEHLYRKYKEEYGSIHQSVEFFKSLSEKSKTELIANLEVRNREPKIEDIAKYLYNWRSEFVHEANLVLNMSGRLHIRRDGNKFVICKLSLDKLMTFFEEGLIVYFMPNAKSQE